MNTIVKYLELIRFSHTLFALPFALLSAAMAVKLNLSENPAWHLRFTDAAGILLCMVFARSAAMSFNRIADRKIDAVNPRTANRHLPKKLLTVSSVWIFTTCCSLGFIASTLLFFPNVIPAVFSVPVLFFLLLYSYAKRWTAGAHFWLGTALMLAPMAAWVVIRPPTALVPPEWPPMILGLAVLFWSSSFDIIYATQDAEFDKKTGLHSVPGRFGVSAAFRLAALCQAVAVVLFAAVPLVYPPFGVLFWCGVAVTAVILAAEHWIATPKKEQSVALVRVNIAFFHLNAVISIGLFLIGVLDAFVV
ncbi:MAG: putative 4-hydroxybenzoate polyprenyltransferase [Planctomycetaceae bacterium]|jgi:4-hydroxybenzoate polyprenyltransferase|nr:putative 4-hydroxybenzoate polyprenyltransferase [Planctomycetaceae bacterium]